MADAHPINAEVIKRAAERWDTLADRGVPPPIMASEHGIDADAMLLVGQERALLVYAVATGQVEPRPGYQPTRIAAPTSDQERLLWGYFTGTWFDGFLCGVLAQREATKQKEESA